MMKRSSAEMDATMSPEIREMVQRMIREQVPNLVSSFINEDHRSEVSNEQKHEMARRFGSVAFKQANEAEVSGYLKQKLAKTDLKRRPGPGGTRLTYLESWKAIELANNAFGFNGWACTILKCEEIHREHKDGKWCVAYSSDVRIELKDGTYHEDTGIGRSDGQRDVVAAIEQSKKSSISDARKRTLRLFGEYLGNSCYDQEHVRDAYTNKPAMPPRPPPSTSAAISNAQTPTKTEPPLPVSPQRIPPLQIQPNIQAAQPLQHTSAITSTSTGQVNTPQNSNGHRPAYPAAAKRPRHENGPSTSNATAMKPPMPNGPRPPQMNLQTNPRYTSGLQQPSMRTGVAFTGKSPAASTTNLAGFDVTDLSSSQFDFDPNP